MDGSICIVCPSSINAPSETFIQRHMRELLPGKTAIITHETYASGNKDWNKSIPTMIIQPEAVLSQNNFKYKTIKTFIKRLLKDFPNENNWIKLTTFLKENKVQIMMGEYLDLSFPWLEIAQKLEINFFVHAHGYDVSEMLRYAEWREKYLAYDQADGIITMSEYSRQKLVSLGLNPKKIHVIPYGVEVPEAPIKRSRHDTILCLSVGRMVAKKSPINTLTAFHKASKICPELQLIYVGSGELMPMVEQFIQDFNLDKKVTLYGSQSNEFVLDLMTKADIFLQHSVTVPETGDQEGLPVAILEAMAYGLPVISTWHAGIPEAVVDGSTGYLVDEGDSSMMAEYIVKLASDPALRERFGKAGQYQVKENFSWEKERKDLLTVLGIQSLTV